jgi:hypothetical protein
MANSEATVGAESMEVGATAGAEMSDATEAPDLGSKVFVLGVGAQRSGTSWLHAYLSSHPCVYMSEIKEIHYFDALWSENHRLYAHNQFTFALKRVASGIDGKGSRLSPEVAAQRVRALTDRVAMFEGGDKAYIDFFQRRVAPHHTHFGEITPAYSLLPAESFRHVRSLFANIKVVFLMRDPVRRIHSALRMREAPTKPKANEAFFTALSNPTMVDRTRYDVTIANLRAVFPAEFLFFGFYETLFCEASIRSLCEFLGLAYKPGDYGRYVNASAGQYVPLTADQIQAGRSAFAETYAYCRREFGSAVPASWYGW